MTAGSRPMTFRPSLSSAGPPDTGPGRGQPVQNAAITRDILNGDKGPRRDIVLLNAGAALVVAGKAADIEEGVQVAGKSIDAGAAEDKLQQLIQFTHDGAVVSVFPRLMQDTF